MCGVFIPAEAFKVFAFFACSLSPHTSCNHKDAEGGRAKIWKEPGSLSSLHEHSCLPLTGFASMVTGVRNELQLCLGHYTHTPQSPVTMAGITITNASPNKSSHSALRKLDYNPRAVKINPVFLTIVPRDCKRPTSFL